MFLQKFQKVTAPLVLLYDFKRTKNHISKTVNFVVTDWAEKPTGCRSMMPRPGLL